MTTARQRGGTRLLAVALTLLLLTAVPTVAAQDDTSSETTIPETPTFSCELKDPDGSPDWSGCIVKTIVDGIGGVVLAGFGGVAFLFNVILSGFGALVLQPFLGIFGGFFDGLRTSFSTLGSSIFSGVDVAFEDSFTSLSTGAQKFGIFAPVVVFGVAGILLWGGAVAIRAMFNTADDPFPEFVEDTFDDDDDDGDD